MIEIVHLHKNRLPGWSGCPKPEADCKLIRLGDDVPDVIRRIGIARLVRHQAVHHVRIVELLLAMVAYNITIIETWNSFGIERLPHFKHEALCERPGFSAVHDPCSLRAFGCRMVLPESFASLVVI